eukprot:GHVU01093215.1.p1 GENE.GHVU01093215.1~~GHVU01093215.1.p1  ORF type:complete len:359 (+),score=64.88 GHVU01093215.1:193-1269(+)
MLRITVLLLIGIAVCAVAQDKQEKLRELQSKLKTLEEELTNLKYGLEKRHDENAKLEAFKRGLTEEERDLVNRMKSKSRYLKIALESEGGTDDEEIAPVEENEIEKRIEDDNELDSLTEEQKRLLKAFPAKIEAVKAALRSEGATADQDSAATMVAKRVEENEALRSLTDEQQALLAKFPSKLEAVETAMAEEGAPLSLDAQPAQGKREEESVHLTPEEHQVLMKLKLKLQDLRNNVQKKEEKVDNMQIKRILPAQSKVGKFGSLVLTRAQREQDVWASQPAESKEITARTLPDSKCGDDGKLCNPLDKVSRRFLSDMKFAQSNGLTLKDLLRALRAKKASLKVTREERELRDLTKKH